MVEVLAVTFCYAVKHENAKLITKGKKRKSPSPVESPVLIQLKQHLDGLSDVSVWFVVE